MESCSQRRATTFSLRGRQWTASHERPGYGRRTAVASDQARWRMSVATEALSGAVSGTEEPGRTADAAKADEPDSPVMADETARGDGFCGPDELGARVGRSVEDGPSQADGSCVRVMWISCMIFW